MKRFKQGGRLPLLIVLMLSFAGLGAVPANATTGSEIENLPVLDALNRNENPLSFAGQWSALQWDSESATRKTGQDTTSGWGPYDGYPSINGAYWKPTSFSGVGTAASLKMMVNPGSEGGRHIALWLNMSSPGSTKSGYQFKWVENEGTYALTLSKWVNGTQTVFESYNLVKIPTGTTLAISKKGPTVTAWTDLGGTLQPFLIGNDNTFTSGYAGIEGSGSLSRSINFKAGAIGSLAADIAAVPTLDTLQREEIPLSNEGKWTALNWATASHKSGRATVQGWNVPSSYLPSGGAYWNPALLTDAVSSNTASGEVVAVTMGQTPTTEGRWASVWLDMPSPSTEKTGYQLRWTQNAGSTMTAELYKWIAGSATLLASKSPLSIPVGTTLALSDQNGTVRAWQGTGANLSELLSASDATFSSGYAGIEAAGAYTRLKDFRAGMLPGAPKLANLALLDSFNRANESPLSNGGKWLKASWAGNTGRVHEFGGSNYLYSGQNWGSLYNSELSSAYWQSSTFSEGVNGNAVSVARLKASPYPRQSLWLDMPGPGKEKSGYELSVEYDEESLTGLDWVITLSKWVAGKQTVLATQAGIESLVSLALVKKGGILSAWTVSPSENDDFDYRPQLTVADSTYSSGSVGLEETGYGDGGLANFSAGGLGS